MPCLGTNAHINLWRSPSIIKLYSTLLGGRRMEGSRLGGSAVVWCYLGLVRFWGLGPWVQQALWFGLVAFRRASYYTGHAFSIFSAICYCWQQCCKILLLADSRCDWMLTLKVFSTKPALHKTFFLEFQRFKKYKIIWRWVQLDFKMNLTLCK